MPGGPGDFMGISENPTDESPQFRKKSPVFDVSADDYFPIFGGLYTRGMGGAWPLRLPAL